MSTYRITFVTPLFSKGSYDNRPEIRPASIRGQLHWWFRALGGGYQDEKAIFGGVHQGATASKVVVRVGNVTGTTGEIATLPHKFGGAASPKAAYRPGAAFDLHILSRLGGLADRLDAGFQRTLEAWLLLGTLGLRSTRAAGSFQWAPIADTSLVPAESFAEYEARCKDILKEAPLRFALLNEEFTDAEQARRIVSDTLGGRDDREGESDLAQLHHPLGKVFGGRKTSPLRFRLVKIGGRSRIAAIWDNRVEVTGNRPQDLDAVIELLAKKNKRIGALLKPASFS